MLSKLQDAVEELCSARRVEAWVEDSRFARVAVIVLRIHVCVRHRPWNTSQRTTEGLGKQNAGTRKLECGRLGDRTFIGRLGCRARPAVGGWEPWQFGGAACAAGQRIGRQTPRDAEYCRRDARRERENASGSLAKCFTREIPYSLSVCHALCVTRMRSLRPFRRGSPNGKPLDSAPRCPSRGTRRAFSLAEAARTLRLDGRLFRASPSQTPSTGRSARCNANRFNELSTALTPSNMEGRTRRRPARTGRPRSRRFGSCSRTASRGCFGGRRSLQLAKFYRIVWLLCMIAALSAKPSIRQLREQLVRWHC